MSGPPEITEEIRTIDLEPKALKPYQELEKESFVELRDSEVTAPNILTKLLRLSQVTGGHLDASEQKNIDAMADQMKDYASGLTTAAMVDGMPFVDAETGEIIEPLK